MSVTRLAVETLARSWIFEVVPSREVEQARAAGESLVYVVWHAGLLPALWQHRREALTLLISRHRDAGRLADAVTRWGYRVVRGSSTRGGSAGLRALMNALRSGGSVGVTPDGPRGPSRTAKPGVVAAAQATGVRIVPMGTAASRAWRLRSWDRFIVPRPFARVRVVYGEPFAVDRSPGAFERGLTALQAGLEGATQMAECAG